MTDDPRVLRALAALAENDRDKSVSTGFEASLLREFRARKAKRRMVWVLGSGLAAAAVILLSVTGVKRPAVVSKPVAQVVAHVEAPSARQEPAQVSSPVISKVASKAPRVPVAAAPPPEEVATDFFSLMDPAPPFDRGQVLRVQVPAAAMRTVGLPVSDDHLADPIQADVVVGEEGLVRAIRFVKFQVQ